MRPKFSYCEFFLNWIGRKQQTCYCSSTIGTIASFGQSIFKSFTSIHSAIKHGTATVFVLCRALRSFKPLLNSTRKLEYFFVIVSLKLSKAPHKQRLKCDTVFSGITAIYWTFSLVYREALDTLLYYHKRPHRICVFTHEELWASFVFNWKNPLFQSNPKAF